MKKLLFLFAILFIGNYFAVADVSTSDVSKIGNDYYIWKNGTYIRYEKQGNDYYGSDGFLIFDKL